MNYTEIENPIFWSRCGKILMKKKHTLVCEIENPGEKELHSRIRKKKIKKN